MDELTVLSFLLRWEQRTHRMEVDLEDARKAESEHRKRESSLLDGLRRSEADRERLLEHVATKDRQIDVLEREENDIRTVWEERTATLRGELKQCSAELAKCREETLHTGEMPSRIRTLEMSLREREGEIVVLQKCQGEEVVKMSGRVEALERTLRERESALERIRRDEDQEAAVLRGDIARLEGDARRAREREEESGLKGGRLADELDLVRREMRGVKEALERER